MAKRKRENSSSETGGSGAKGKDGGEPSGREKKRRPSHTPDSGEIISELYETVRNHKDDNGRVLCESFIRVPKRRSCPDYYDVVSTPIDLLKIQQRVKTEEYEDVEELSKDFELLFNNAKSYYNRNSQEYNDACMLAELFEETKKDLCAALEDTGDADDDDEEGADDVMEEEKDFEESKGNKQDSSASDSTPDSKSRYKRSGRPKGRPTAQEEAKRLAASCMIDDIDDGQRSFNPYEEMLDAIISLKDSHGRVLCELFKKLPPQEFYPEYYRVINEPIDLKTICQNYKNNMYKHFDELERDLQLMVKNAHTFNEPGSQIYRDATAIKKVIQGKKSDIDHVLLGTKTSERLSGKRTHRDPGKRARRSLEKGVSLVDALIDGCDFEYAAVPQIEEEIMGDEYDEETFSLMEGEDENENAEDNPMMALFSEIYNFVDATGRAIAEPYLRLPSRRAYPDYYQVIKNPIGLLRIRHNIKNYQYDNLDDLGKDFEQCFVNAQTYNEPNSMLHKDAFRLLDVSRRKKKELIKLLADKGISMEELTRRNVQKREVEAEMKAALPGDEPEEQKVVKKVKKTAETDLKNLKKRMRMIYKAVESVQGENGRFLSDIFMELPPKQDYPDYYEVISEPICLRMIEANIREGKYKVDDEMMIDFEIMFDNARYYNEEESQVYQDANILQNILKKKRKSLGTLNTTPAEASAQVPMVTAPHTPQKHTTPTKKQWTSPVIKKYPQVPTSSIELKALCRDLFNSVRDCSDRHGRQLCLIFQRLPARSEYPDYYTLIKKPIDMAKINSKLNSDQYSNLDDFLNDFYLMFDNACKYNEPDSQVYKDALELQRELLRKKYEFIADEGGRVPNVQGLVQKLFRDIFSAVVDHQDEEGRCFSDSLAEVTCIEKGRKITLKTIGSNLRKCRYTRLDKLQEDLFLVFEKARSISRVDSEMYEDAAELQLFYMTKRDELTKSGERFVSPALSFTKRHLQQELDEEKKKRMETESQEDDRQRTDEGEKKDVGENGEDELTTGNVTYRVGDFLYIKPREEGLKPHIVSVEKLWTDHEGEKWLYGTWFYRPSETFHLATRKFLEKEVFRSDYSSSVKLSDVMYKCHVMFVKEYFKSKPEGFNEGDVYVCESKYYVKPKAFKKIKLWSMPSSYVRLLTRDEPLMAKRVPSVFADGSQDMRRIMREGQYEEESRDTDEQEIPDDRKNVTIEVQNPDYGCIYYEQFKTPVGFVKLGDCVYVRSDENYLQLARIDKMWMDRSGAGWFHGPWFVTPVETIHLPTKMFYDKEVFFSSVEETNLLNNIAGLCCVLQIREFSKCRPTEIPEKDIFLCESRYDETEGHIRKLKGLKRVTLSLNVQEDEWYFFEDPINPSRKPSPLLASEKDLKSREERAISPAPSDDSGKLLKQKKMRGHSGYLLFSNEMRSVVKKDHPEYSFGEISRVIGVEWRNMNGPKKAEYEARAQMQLSQINETTEVSQHVSKENHSLWVYSCLWANCDHQYQDLQDLVIHVLESGGHLQISESHVYPCLWATCHRMKRGFKPYPSASKLARHLREIHLRCEPRQISTEEQSKNYFLTHQAAPLPEPEPESEQPRSSVSTPSLPTPSMPTTGGSPMMSQPVPGGATPQPGMQGFPNQGMRMMPSGMQQGMPHQQQYGGNVNYVPPSQTSPMMMNRPTPHNNNNLGPSPNMSGPNSQHVGMMQGNNFMPQQQQQQHQAQQYMQQQQQQQQQPQTPQQHPQHMMQQQMMQSQQFQQHVQQYQSPQGQTPYNQPQHSMPPQAQTPPIPHQNGGQHADTAPIFIAPPQKTEKLRHSEAYLRYIEGMRDGSPHLSNWNIQRRPDLTPQQMSQLPVHWLGGGYGRHENAVDALWALRDFMLQDALSISKLSK